MPITIPDALPAKTTLEAENIFIMPEERAAHQDIRPLRLVLLNLMPKKIETETQLLRLLGNTPLQVQIDLMCTATHKPKNTPAEHLLQFYKSFDELKHQKYDGMIVTGAPVELLDFEQVDYWQELCTIFDWATKNVTSTLYICWGAQAGLYYHYGIGKHPLPAKMFGIFEHRILSHTHPLLRGFDEVFWAPHSRNTESDDRQLTSCADLDILSVSDQAGVYIAASKDHRRIFITGHCEYDRDTLKQEYLRDVQKGLSIAVPVNYFPGDDPAKTPNMTWRSHANLFFSNWLNYCVYQTTPYDINMI